MTEQLQPQIRALLREAEAKGEIVTDLARSCLAHFRKDCQAILEGHEVNLMGSIAEVGSEDGLPELIRERDDALDEARRQLKERLEKLLQTAAEGKLC